MDEENKKSGVNLDILKTVEDISLQLNELMAKRTKSVFKRYPISFALLVLVGVVAVSEGLKGILEGFNFIDNPWYLLFGGLIILMITGQIYKRLDK